MIRELFFRLLTSPIPAKGEDLRQQIAALNEGKPAEGVFQADPADFGAIPGTPFAYWASKSIRSLFKVSSQLEANGREVQSGASTMDDFQFLRCWWEINSSSSARSRKETEFEGRWVPFAKGGVYSPYYCDWELVVDWKNDGEVVKKIVADYRGRHGWGYNWTAALNGHSFYFRPGLTWPRRTTSGISVRPLPQGSIFADKSPSCLVPEDNQVQLLILMALMNSKPFSALIDLQLGAATVAARSYEVGILEKMPFPAGISQTQYELDKFALRSYELARLPSLGDETAHVFRLPALCNVPGTVIVERLQTIDHVERERQSALADLQTQIDARIAELYGVPELAGGSIEQPDSAEGEASPAGKETKTDEQEDDEEAGPASVLCPPALVSDFLMWCVGVAFGRWDVRYALHPESLPALPDPFDPLPVCSSGMLVGEDGLPLSASPEGYPLPVAWDGFLVDDPGHQQDVVAAVRRVLRLLWQDQADDIEAEACQILGVPDLRTWLRDPRGFFAYHIKRYSKSRRKAPIYWLLQSAKRNYGIWLYYPRLNPGSLFRAGREYADAKLNLETERLNDLKNGLPAALGSSRKLHERKIAAQTALAAEIKTYLKALDAAALLELKPDLNDGVLLNIAPLHQIVPWKEAERAWGELLLGKYEWSSIGKHLRARQLVKAGR